MSLASLYCTYCFEAGQIINDTIIATQPEWMPDNLLSMQKITHWEMGFLSASPVYTVDNTYTQAPDKIVYNLESLSQVFNILYSKPNPDNIFNITNILPNTYEISEIIYENGDENISLKNLISSSPYPRENSNLTKYTINLLENENIIKNATGKITVFISQK